MSNINAKKINDVVVEPIVLPKQKKDILGCKLFPQLNNNIFICAPKNSGKTTVIKTILDQCADERTHVIIFCATIYNDPSWKAILNMLDDKGIKHSDYTSIFADEGTNIVDVLISELSAPKSELISESPNIPFLKFNEEKPKETVTIKKKKKKYLAPDYIIIFDDLSSELKNPSIPKLMKIQRHFSSKIIISSQSYIDCDSRIRNGNLDVLLLFKKLPDHILEKIYNEQAITLPFELFLKLYKHATKKPYSFLYIDRNGYFRKNFNREYVIE